MCINFHVIYQRHCRPRVTRIKICILARRSLLTEQHVVKLNVENYIECINIFADGYMYIAREKNFCSNGFEKEAIEIYVNQLSARMVLI